KKTNRPARNRIHFIIPMGWMEVPERTSRRRTRIRNGRSLLRRCPRFGKPRFSSIARSPWRRAAALESPPAPLQKPGDPAASPFLPEAATPRPVPWREPLQRQRVHPYRRSVVLAVPSYYLLSDS